jgi:hypothetical protein
VELNQIKGFLAANRQTGLKNRYEGWMDIKMIIGSAGQ